MLLWVSLGHLFQNIYLDHDDSLRRRDWDDVVDFPVRDMPAVISPMMARNGQADQHEDPIQGGEDAVAEPQPIMVIPPEHPVDVMAGGSRPRRETRRVPAAA